MILRNRVIACAVLSAGLGACSDTSDFNFETSIDTAEEQLIPTVAVYDPVNAIFPFPNSLFFSGSTDGTLNIPVVDPDNLADPQVSLNAMDGFSTTSPITMRLRGGVDTNSLIIGETVRVFEVQTTAEGAVVGVDAELDASQLVAAVAGESLAILPLVPLKESTDYAVVVTNGVLNEYGVPLSADSAFRLVAGPIELTDELSPGFSALEPLRLLTNALLDAVTPEGVEGSSVVQAWSFKTQSITPVMEAVKSVSNAATITIAPSGSNTSAFQEALPGIADIYIGTLELPYYRTAPASVNDPTGITSYWQGAGGGNVTRFNTTPVATSVQTVPVLMSVPNAASGSELPENGWPVAIFVHGVTSSRLAMIPIADAMAQAGFAVIAIDQPMHGITATDNPLAAINTPFNDTERTFDLDLINNLTGAAGPDGETDPSGRHFYSPQYLLATRDNLRQSVADLLVLSNSIANITTVPLNAAVKTVIGHSLGGSVATPFLALDDTITAATLGMPAAGMVGTILSSDVFGPPTLAGLLAAGLEEGTADFEAFKVVAQTLADSGDAINFGQQAAQNVPIHMIEVVGDGTVKNSVPGSPLVGTDALARVMGLPQTSGDTTESAIVKFTAGNHSSLLDPSASLEATLEMQAQTAAFAASSGALIRITNPDVVQ